MKKRRFGGFVEYNRLNSDFRAERNISSMNRKLDSEMPSVGKIKRKKMRR